MYRNIFDSHAHYDDEQFELDRNELLVSFKENGISGVVCCGVDVKTSEFAVQLSHKYDFEDFRPQLCAICMDNEEKTAVATNAHILFASKEYYVDKGREGESKTLVDEYGDVVKEELRYPNWKAVIPREDQTEPIVLRSDLKEIIKLAQVEAKELGLKKIDSKTHIRVADNICIRLDFLKLMLKAGVDGWRKPKKERSGGIVKQWDGNTMLVMPVMPSDAGDEYDNFKNKGYWFDR